MDTVEFFSTLWGGISDGIVNFRLIKKGNRPYAVNKWAPVGKVKAATQQALDWFTDKNQDFHIYHRIALTQSRDDCKFGSDNEPTPFIIPALWCDVDSDSPEALQRLQQMDLYPNIIVHSGGGFHGYWLLNTPYHVTDEDSQHKIERINHGIAIAAHADEVCRNVNRIMRTPGYLNIKPKYDPPPRARVIEYDNSGYELDTLYNVFAPLGAPKAPKITREIPTRAIDKTLPRWVQDYLTSPVGRGNRNNRLYAVALEYRARGYTEMDAQRDLMPKATGTDGLPKKEALRTIRSAYHGNVTPEPPTHTQYTQARIRHADAKIKRGK